MAKDDCNFVFLRGRVGQDGKLRELDNGSAVLNFSIATGVSHKTETGWDEKTTWHYIVKWFKKDENRFTPLQGEFYQVDGELEENKWEDDKGKHKDIRIKAHHVVQCVKGQSASQKTPSFEEKMGNKDSDIPF